MTAVKADNTTEAINLIGKGVDPNSRTSPKGWSVLHYAAMNGNVEIVQALLKAGADPNYAGTKDGQATSAARTPLDLAQGMMNIVSGIQPSEIEGVLRQNGLDDPALLKSAKDPNAEDRYEKIVVQLIMAMKGK
ncbi:MAG: ankyrin repeat domain-containing protein [Terracidiphilus sp.]